MTLGVGAAEGLGSSQLKRVIPPGLIASIGFHSFLPPNFLTYCHTTYGVGAPVVFLLEILIYGFVLTSAAQPIFFVYEGFRAEWLTYLPAKYNRWRVNRAQDRLSQIYENGSPAESHGREKRLAYVLDQYLRDFPSQGDAASYWYEAERPTRLGNIIAEYELYPKSRYGIDGVLYWFHLIGLASDASREDFRQKSQLAEAVLLSSAAGALVGLASGAAILGFWIGESTGVTLIEMPVDWTEAWWLFGYGLVVWLVFYRLSWPAFRSAGQSFKSLVDLVLPDFWTWLVAMRTPPEAANVQKAEEVAQYIRIIRARKSDRCGAQDSEKE